MARGGKRNGSGRKPGGGNKKKAAVAAKAVAEGKTPVEVMLDVMRRLYDDKDLKAAAAVAAQVAPYCHPRLGSIVVKGDKENPVRLEIVEEIVDAAESDPLKE